MSAALVLATVDTGSFQWVALGATREECEQALLTAYRRHVRRTPGADSRLMLELIAGGDVTFSPIAIGQALRDGSPVAPGPRRRTSLECVACGRTMSRDTVAMMDECLGCGASPFYPVEESDQ